ncbi:UPF0481 protein, partial [Cucurbita argyrosperma subsp. argyrosperma]
MVAVFNKELLSWYLITLKLRETVESGLPVINSNSANSVDSQEKSELQLQGQRQNHSESHRVIIEDEDQKLEEDPESPESGWVITIKEKLGQAHQDEVESSWAKVSIYKVPHYLKDGDDKAVVPQIVSLGPYHHGKRRVRQMERHKWRSLHHILERTKHDIKLYLDAMKELEEKARSCYEGPFSYSSNEFVEMMVLDGCFVLELFRGAAEGFKQLGYPRNDPIFAMRELQLGDHYQKGLVAELALRFFDPLTPNDEPLTKSNLNKLESSLGNTTAFDPLGYQGGLHCLDVFRQSLLRSGPKLSPKVWIKRRSHTNRVADKRRQQLIHCVKELKDAGIRFQKKKTDRFWDINFNNGVMQIPRLLIHDGTRSLFLNLIAFEQCHLDCSNDITSYVVFMDNLIDSHEDVAYLHYCGIIEHWLGSDEEVAELFNRLCQEVVYDINASYLSQLSEDVNRYYNHKWNAWRATLKHNYFSNPWAIISLVAAVVLLLLTFAQTFYGVYGYYRPPN